MRSALTLAGFALVLAGLTGCGSDGSDGADADDPPTNASTEDFCANFEDLNTELMELIDSGDIPAAIAVLKEATEKMEETGTPEDMPEDARAGLATTIDSIQALDDDATEEEVGAIGEGLSDTEEANSAAFDDYLEMTCDLS